MRIGIDVSSLCTKWDGIGTYLIDVIDYINSLGNNNNYFYLYSNIPTLKDVLPNNENFIIRSDCEQNHLIWMILKLPKQIKIDKLDVFWQPNYLFPVKVEGVKNIVTVHDMSAYCYSKYASTKTNLTHKLFLKSTCKKANVIIVDSYNCEEELVQQFPAIKDKVKMIYIGKKMFKDGLNASQEECIDCFNNLGIKIKDYLLFVGTLSPRKNAEVIIEGYFKYRKNGGKRKLVLAGNIATKCDNIKNKIESSRYVNDIIVAGYVTDLQKRILYYHAAMLLFPSRLEGFGFPLLEGMQAEIPVITSNCSCMPEIAKDAAIYLNDINSIDEMAQRIFEVEHMKEEEKKILIEKGKDRVRFFDQMNYPKHILEELLKG